MGAGFYWSILFMLGVVGTLLGSFVTVVWRNVTTETRRHQHASRETL